MSSAMSSASDGGKSLRPISVARKVDPGLDEQAAHALFAPGGGADAGPLPHVEVAGFGAEMGGHDQEPVHALGLRAKKFGALPPGKGRKCGRRGPADEIDRA